jgi:hypothetical protein
MCANVLIVDVMFIWRNDMLLPTNIITDFQDLNTMLEEHNIPCDGHTKLAMNDYTVHALTGKHFYQDRRQTYYGFSIIEDSWCSVGEVIVLVNYEYFRRNDQESGRV